MIEYYKNQIQENIKLISMLLHSTQIDKSARQKYVRTKKFTKAS
jgi:hypothetical protein